MCSTLCWPRLGCNPCLLPAGRMRSARAPPACAGRAPGPWGCASASPACAPRSAPSPAARAPCPPSRRPDPQPPSQHFSGGHQSCGKASGISSATASDYIRGRDSAICPCTSEFWGHLLSSTGCSLLPTRTRTTLRESIDLRDSRTQGFKWLPTISRSQGAYLAILHPDGSNGADSVGLRVQERIRGSHEQASSHHLRPTP